jgi:hypothetical protein
MIPQLLPLLDDPPRIGRLLRPVHVLGKLAQRDHLVAFVMQVLHVLGEPLGRRVHPWMLDVRSAVELQNRDLPLDRLGGRPLQVVERPGRASVSR